MFSPLASGRTYRTILRENERGYYNLSILGVDRDPKDLMFLSREIYENCVKFIRKCMYIYKMLYKNRRFKQIIFNKYATNRRYPRGARQT